MMCMEQIPASTLQAYFIEGKADVSEQRRNGMSQDPNADHRHDPEQPYSAPPPDPYASPNFYSDVPSPPDSYGAPPPPPDPYSVSGTPPPPYAYGGVPPVPGYGAPQPEYGYEVPSTPLPLAEAIRQLPRQ